MIDLYKPVFNKDSNKSILFDRFEQPLAHRPIVVFYNEYSKTYYYLKLRSARTLNNSLKDTFDGEILISQSVKPNGLPWKDSLLDTTQIYKIDEYLLEKEIDKKDILYLSTDVLDSKTISKIQIMLHRNLSSTPPNVSLCEVSVNNYGFIGTIKYSNENLLKKDYSKLQVSSNKYDDYIKNVLDERNLNNETLNELQSLEAFFREELYYNNEI